MEDKNHFSYVQIMIVMVILAMAAKMIAPRLSRAVGADADAQVSLLIGVLYANACQSQFIHCAA